MKIFRGDASRIWRGARVARTTVKTSWASSCRKRDIVREPLKMFRVMSDFFLNRHFLFPQNETEMEIKNDFLYCPPRAPSPSLRRLFGGTQHFSCNKRFTLRPPFLSGRFARAFVTLTGNDTSRNRKAGRRI